MTRRLLDTDIFSEILKGIDPRVVTRATAYKAEIGRYTISTITVMEVVGASNSSTTTSSWRMASGDVAGPGSRMSRNLIRWLYSPIPFRHCRQLRLRGL